MAAGRASRTRPRGHRPAQPTCSPEGPLRGVRDASPSDGAGVQVQENCSPWPTRRTFLIGRSHVPISRERMRWLRSGLLWLVTWQWGVLRGRGRGRADRLVRVPSSEPAGGTVPPVSTDAKRPPPLFPAAIPADVDRCSAAACGPRPSFPAVARRYPDHPRHSRRPRGVDGRATPLPSFSRRRVRPIPLACAGKQTPQVVATRRRRGP